jgi:uncharacterized protein YjiS (DUF1127 family)
MTSFPLGAATGRGTHPFRQPAAQHTFLHRAVSTPHRVFGVLREWRQRARDRAELASLDDRTLRDIGISRVEVWREINKPFWRN